MHATGDAGGQAGRLEAVDRCRLTIQLSMWEEATVYNVRGYEDVLDRVINRRAVAI